MSTCNFLSMHIISYATVSVTWIGPSCTANIKRKNDYIFYQLQIISWPIVFKTLCYFAGEDERERVKVEKRLQYKNL
jgi:hypothetical protein